MLVCFSALIFELILPPSRDSAAIKEKQPSESWLYYCNSCPRFSFFAPAFNPPTCILINAHSELFVQIDKLAEMFLELNPLKLPQKAVYRSTRPRQIGVLARKLGNFKIHLHSSGNESINRSENPKMSVKRSWEAQRSDGNGLEKSLFKVDSVVWCLDLRLLAFITGVCQAEYEVRREGLGRMLFQITMIWILEVRILRNARHAASFVIKPFCSNFFSRRLKASTSVPNYLRPPFAS